MRIYFTASLTGKKDFGEEYRKIVSTMESMGHQVYSEHILKNDPEKVLVQSREQTAAAYKEISRQLKSSDLVVIESSFPSTAVGYEISLALENSKPVVVLHQKGKKSFLLEGKVNDRLQMVPYSADSLKEVLEKAIKKAEGMVDVRFNFFVTPQILSYLDWIAKNRKIPRAVYLRRLIERDMGSNKDYKEG